MLLFSMINGLMYVILYLLKTCNLTIEAYKLQTNVVNGNLQLRNAYCIKCTLHSCVIIIYTSKSRTVL